MKQYDFQQQIGGTSNCTKIIIKATKGYSKMSSNDNFFSDRWFSGLKAADDENEEGVDYCKPIKTIQKVFLLDTL